MPSNIYISGLIIHVGKTKIPQIFYYNLITRIAVNTGALYEITLALYFSFRILLYICSYVVPLPTLVGRT